MAILEFSFAHGEDQIYKGPRLESKAPPAHGRPDMSGGEPFPSPRGPMGGVGGHYGPPAATAPADGPPPGPAHGQGLGDGPPGGPKAKYGPGPPRPESPERKTTQVEF